MTYLVVGLVFGYAIAKVEVIWRLQRKLKNMNADDYLTFKRLLQ